MSHKVASGFPRGTTMIDLHAHTNISDGTYSPKELIETAVKAGLSAIAVTDHDSIDGLAEARREAEKQEITLVQGIEFSAAYGENRLIHILGLGIDPEDPAFLEIYTAYRKTRSESLDHVFQKLPELGISLTPADAAPYMTGQYPDRQAIAKTIVAKGYVPLIKNAWMGYLDHIPYRQEELIQPKKAIQAIHAAGGKAFLAHFHMPIGLKGYSDLEARRRLGELKDWGLDGMEYYYPSYTEEDSRLCDRYIRDFGFLRSGGTDFHGANRAHIQLGTGEGDFAVPDELLNTIIPAAGRALKVS